MKNWKTAGAFKALKNVKSRAWRQFAAAKKDSEAAWKMLEEVKADANASKTDYAKAISEFGKANEWKKACGEFYATCKAKCELAEKACEPEDLEELKKIMLAPKSTQKPEGTYTKPDGSDAFLDDEFVPF